MSDWTGVKVDVGSREGSELGICLCGDPPAVQPQNRVRGQGKERTKLAMSERGTYVDSKSELPP